MTNTELFTDFLSDNLNSKNETEFISKLSSDLHFKQEFKSYMALNSTLKEMPNHFTPSEELNNKVFASVGIPNLLNTAPSGLIKPPNRFLSKKLITGVASVVTSIILFLFLFDYYGDTNSLIKPVKIDKEQSFTLNDIPDLITSDNDNDNQQSNYNSSSNFANLLNIGAFLNGFSDNLNNFSHAFDNSNSNSQEIKDINLFTDNISHSNGIIPISFEKVKQIFQNSNLIPEKLSDISKKLSVELKHSPSRGFTKEVVPPSIKSAFNDIELSLFYDIDNRWSIGSSIIQESYQVENTVDNDLGNIVTNYEHPVMVSFLANVNYNFNKYFNFIEPYVGFGLGGNVYGLVVKEKVGLLLHINNRFYLKLAGDLSQYHNNGKNNSSVINKYGINYGLGFNIR